MYLVFDIGKTKMRLATYSEDEGLGIEHIAQVPESFADFAQEFSIAAKKCSQGVDIKAAVGGIGMPLNKDRTTSVGRHWVDEPIKETLEKELGVPVYLHNDAAMVGLGEAVHGAGVGYNVVAYVTVSTGVGGARIVNGEIDEYSVGFEPGHQIIDPDKTLCLECAGNTLEEYVSGAAIAKRFEKPPYEIPQSDPLWNELAQFLAYGLNNIIVHWRPDVVVLGGSMIVGDPAILIKDIQKHLKNTLTIFPEAPPVVLAQLGDVGGLHGAVAYIKQSEK